MTKYEDIKEYEKLIKDIKELSILELCNILSEKTDTFSIKEAKKELRRRDREGYYKHIESRIEDLRLMELELAEERIKLENCLED